MILRPAGDSSTDDEEEMYGFSAPKIHKNPKLTKEIEKREETPLEIFKSAIYNNQLDLVQKALASGADINEPITFGWTALMHACQIVNVELVQFLLENGANPNISYEKVYPIIVLVKAKGDEENKLECLKLLLSADSKYNCFDQYDTVPLMYAIKDNLVTIVDHLLSLPNINLNHRDRKGKTSLFWAVKAKNALFVAKLIEAGALLDLRDFDDQTALDYAKLNGSKEIIQLLGNECEEDGFVEGGYNSITLNFRELFLELPFYSRSAFKSDIINFIHGVDFCDPSHVYQQDIEFGDILAGNDRELKQYGIAISCGRNYILENIKTLHMINWEREPLQFSNKKEIDLIDLIQNLYNLLRAHYLMTASVNFLLNCINRVSSGKSNIDTKLILNLKDELSHSKKMCEIISLKLNKVRQKVHEFKSNNNIVYGDLIGPMKPKSKKYKYVKGIFFIGGITLTWIFFGRSLKTFS